MRRAPLLAAALLLTAVAASPQQMPDRGLGMPEIKRQWISAMNRKDYLACGLNRLNERERRNLEEYVTKRFILQRYGSPKPINTRHVLGMVTQRLTEMGIMTELDVERQEPLGVAFELGVLRPTSSATAELLQNTAHWKFGRGIGSRNFWEQGDGPRTLKYWKFGRGRRTENLWKFGKGPGSRDHWLNGEGPGSRAFWTDGEGPGSKAFWETN